VREKEADTMEISHSSQEISEYGLTALTSLLLLEPIGGEDGITRVEKAVYLSLGRNTTTTNTEQVSKSTFQGSRDVDGWMNSQTSPVPSSNDQPPTTIKIKGARGQLSDNTLQWVRSVDISIMRSVFFFGTLCYHWDYTQLRNVCIRIASTPFFPLLVSPKDDTASDWQNVSVHKMGSSSPSWLMFHIFNNNSFLLIDLSFQVSAEYLLFELQHLIRFKNILSSIDCSIFNIHLRHLFQLLALKS